MSRLIRVQTNFTSGELDPKLRARTDLQQYYNGMETAQNVVVQPQGGIERRDGTRFITQLPASAADAVRMVHFEFSVSDSYMLVFVDERMYVFKDGVLITDINGSGNDYLAVPKITDAIIDEMCWAQSADTLVVTHQSVIPQKIVRGATDASWTVSDLSFDFIPKFAYAISTTSGDSVGTHDFLTVDAPDGNIIIEAKTAGTPDTDADIFTGAASDYVNQYINIQPQGRLRIVEKVDNHTLKAVSEIPLFDDTNIEDTSWELESGYEDTWSDTRGWPRTSVFYEGRLYFGGSTSRPSTFWGSRVGSFFDFNPGESLDDSGLEATLDTGRFNAIVDMYAGRNLQLFTTGAEFYVPQTLGDPITPTTLSVQEQTSNGSKPGIRVVNVDGATVFLQRQGKTLSEFLFSDTVNGYVATKISLLSSHLLKTPVEMAVRNATSTDEGNRLLIVNGDDGSIACYTLLRTQEIIAPTEWTTDGEFISVGVDISDTYVVVKRNIDGSDVYYVELFDQDLTLDCATSGTTGSSVSGLSHLEGESIKIIRDGIVEADKTVASGSVTFDSAATSSYQVGLNYTPLVETLPVEPRLASGPIRAFKKRILEINSEHFESYAVTINGEQVAFRQLGENVLDIPVQPFTGIKRSGPLLGFVNEGKITISQSVPLKMNVLALDYKLSVGQ